MRAAARLGVAGPAPCENRTVRPRHLLLGLVIACAALAAGCGGGGAKTYSVDASRACLVKQQARVTPPPAEDLVAVAAEGGAFSVHFPGNVVTVSFGVDLDATERIVRAYQHFGKQPGLKDVLKVKGNAVMLWGVGPNDSDVGTIEGCLK